MVKLDDIVTIPLIPDIESREGQDHYYMFPNTSSFEGPKGILLYLHSCRQSGLDFFTLPEHRILALRAIQKGMIVFSPTSQNRTSGCFASEGAEGYLEKVVNGFIRKYQLEHLPRVGLGDSSGGSLLSFVYRALNLKSIAIFNSPQGYDDEDMGSVAPTVYLTMSTDKSITDRMNSNMLKLKNMNVSSYLYKVSPRPFTESLCKARLPELSGEFCQHILQTMQSDYSNLLDTHSYVVDGDVNSEQWQRCFEKLESDYKTIPSTFTSLEDLVPYRYRKRGNAMSIDTKSWLRIILEKEIQTCHGFHAMTAQFHEEILDFLVLNAKI